MRASASQTQTPQPQPLPLPPPPLSLPSPSTVPRRRYRSASSSSSSSSSVSTASSSFSPSPSPAPSPRAATTSVVPFSWERHPGIPKSSLADLASSASAPLPLPPPPRGSPGRHQRRRRSAASVPASSDPHADPFAAAFVECTREDGTDEADVDVPGKLWPAPTSTVSGRSERRWWLAGSGVVGFLDLYGCKSAMAVADGAFLAHRPVSARPCPGRATQNK